MTSRDRPLAAEARRLRRLAAANHPDVGGDKDVFQRLYSEYLAALKAIREVNR